MGFVSISICVPRVPMVLDLLEPELQLWFHMGVKN